MFFDDLDFLVSPVTGKRKLPKGQIYQGNDDGIEEPSNIITELQELIKKIQDEIEKIDIFPKDATFLLKTAHDKIPNALVMSKLDNGVVFKKEGGELEGKQKIALENLPELKAVKVPGLDMATGQIYRGTASGVPEVSNSLSILEAEALLNVNRLLANMIMGDAIVQSVYPAAQFLVNIKPDGCILKHVGKKLEAAVGGTDFVDVEDGLNAGKLCVIKDNSKFIGRTTITIVDGEHIRDVLSVSADVLNAKSAVNCEDMIVGRKEVVTDGILAVYDPSLRLTLRWGFKGPRGLTRDLIYTPPNKDGNDGDCLATDGNLNLKWVKSGESILDGLDTGIVAFDKSIGNSKLINATLQQGKVWVGNEANKPKQVDFKIASPDASFILQTNFNGLNKAQALDTLGGGMLKADTTGKISIAKAGKGLTDDYVDPNALKEALDEKDEEFKKIKEDCEKARDDAKDSKDKAEEAKTKVDETKEKIDEIKTQLDEKIDEFKTELDEAKTQIEEAQAACEESQATSAASAGEASASAGAAATAAEEASDAAGLAAGSAAAAAGSAAAAAFLIGDVKNKEDKSSHNKDMEHVNGRIDDLQTELNKKSNIAIHGTENEINVVNSFDDKTKTNNFTISLANKSSNIEILGTDKQVIVNKQDNNRVISLDEDLLKNISLAYDFSSKFALTSKDNSITINGLDITVNDRILNEIEEIKQSLQVFANSKDIVIGTHEDGRLELRFSEFTNERFNKIDNNLNTLGNNIEEVHNLVNTAISDTLIFIEDKFKDINVISTNQDIIVNKKEPLTFELTFNGHSKSSDIYLFSKNNSIDISTISGMELAHLIIQQNPEEAINEEKLVKSKGYIIDVSDKILNEIEEIKQSLQVFADSRDIRVGVHDDGRLELRFTEFTEARFNKLNDKIDDFGNKASEAIASTQDTMRETFSQLIDIINTKADKSDIQPSPSGDPEKFKEYITKIVEENTTQFIKADDIPILLDSSNDGLKINKLIHNEWLFTIQKDFIKQIIVETLKEYKLIP